MKTVNRIIALVLVAQLLLSGLPSAHAATQSVAGKAVTGAAVGNIVRMFKTIEQRASASQSDTEARLPDGTGVSVETAPPSSETTQPPPELTPEPASPDTSADVQQNDNDAPENSGGIKLLGGEVSDEFMGIVAAAAIYPPPYNWVEYSFGFAALLTNKGPATYRFAAEGASVTVGYESYNLTGQYASSIFDEDSNRYNRVLLDLPTETKTGRLPDYMPEGWYIYGSQSGSRPGTSWPYIDDLKMRKYASGMSKVVVAPDPNDGKLWVKDGFPGTTFMTIDNPGLAGIQMVANWVKSNKSKPLGIDLYPVTPTGTSNGNNYNFTVSQTPLTLYQRDISAITDAELENSSIPTGFSDGVTDYYMRVGSDVEAVDLSMLAFEPYADYMEQYKSQRIAVEPRTSNGTGTAAPYTFTDHYANPTVRVSNSASPVKVWLKTGDDTGVNPTVTDLTQSKLNYSVLNGGVFNEHTSYPESTGVNDEAKLASYNYWAPGNNATAQARSLWEITGYNSTENPEWWKTADGVAHSRSASRVYTKTGDSYNITDSIPLVQTGGTNKLYNTITIEITAPDGVTKSYYNLHIQRLRDPSAKLLPGNSPIGVVERDTGSTWGANPEATKAAYKNAFLSDTGGKSAFSYPKTTASEPRPTDALNNNSGRLYDREYKTNAWIGLYSANTSQWRGVRNTGTVRGTDAAGAPMYDYNPDIDQNALFVYQDTSFYDPGFAYIYDSQGNTLTGTLKGSMQRSIELTMVETLDYMLLHPNLRAGKTSQKWYTNNASGVTDIKEGYTLEVLKTAGGKDRVDLTGQNILPGVYKMEYVFTDPITGLRYDSTGENFSGEAKERRFEFSRTLVVLPIPGDIDMNGAVTSADTAAYRRLASASVLGDMYLTGSSADPLLALFASRVIDLSNDGRVVDGTSIAPDPSDYNILDGGFEPRLDKSPSDYYYIPLPSVSDAATKTRRNAPMSVSASNVAQLTLDYLGKDRTQPATSEAGKFENPVAQDDVFWVGVRLTNAHLSSVLTGAVDNFTFTLNYDNAYIEPAVALTEDDGLILAAAGGDEWLATIYKYNLIQGAPTIWSPTGSTLNFRPTGTMSKARSLGSHYSKAYTGMENTRGNNVRELVFSIQSASAVDVHFADGYLLVVPFRMKVFPSVGAGNTITLVEMGMGMRELTFVNERPQVAPIKQMRAISTYDEPLSPMDLSTNGEAAYSIQSDIYGGSTDNLKTAFGYSSYSLSVVLGSDARTPITMRQSVGAGELRNAVYGDYFSYPTGILTGTYPAGLPEGLTYYASNGNISGIPEKAGTFTFSVGAQPYLLIVERAPLRVYADNKEKYYGEKLFVGMESFNGTSFLTSPTIEPKSYTACFDNIHTTCGLQHSSLHLTYRYYPCDIKDIDKNKTDSGGVKLGNSGDITDLVALIGNEGLVHPDLYVIDRIGSPIGQYAGVGTYAIISGVIDSSNANYKLIYTNYAYDETGSKAYGYKPESQVEDYTVGNDPFNYAAYGQSVGRLTIRPRPITVGKLVHDQDEVVGEIDDELVSRLLSNLHAYAPMRIGPSFGFTAVLPEKHASDGDYNNTYQRLLLTATDDASSSILSGDTLRITYSAEFMQDDVKDVGRRDNKQFKLAELREKRDVNIHSIALDRSYGSAANYTLVFNSQLAVPNEEQTIVNGGSVVQKPITNIAILTMPPTTYTYGNYLEIINALQVTITNGIVDEDGKVDVDKSFNVSYILDAELKYGINVSLVTELQKKMGWYAEPIPLPEYSPNDPNWDREDLSKYEKNLDGTLKFGAPVEAIMTDGSGNKTTLMLETKHSGLYICVYADAFSSEGSSIKVTAFAEAPIIVNKRNLVLTPQPQNRYYGEANRPLNFTFSKDSLAAREQAALINKNLSLPADMAEFVNLFEDDATYSKPKMTAVINHNTDRTADANKVTKNTPYTNSNNYIVIEDIVTDNYNIIYGRADGTQSSVYGFSYLFIQQRPIVAKTALEIAGDQKYIYADAAKLSPTDALVYRKNVALTSSDEKIADKSTVSFKLPDTVGANYLPTYFTKTKTDVKTVGDASYGSLTGSAIVDGDTLDVLVDIGFIPDNSKTGGIANEMFELGGAADKGYSLVIENLRVQPSTTANNYILVYDDVGDANNGYLADTQLMTKDENGVLKKIETINQALGKPYYRIATNGDETVKGTVVLRPLTALRLLSDPLLTYTYGDTFAPYAANKDGLKFAIEMTFDNRYANPTDPANPTITLEPMEYERSSQISDDSNFKLFGLEIFFVGSTAKSQVYSGGGFVAANQYIYNSTTDTRYLPVSYSGRYIRVAGQRHPSHMDPNDSSNPVMTGLSTGRLNIGKKTLRLDVVPQHKYYGERNMTNLNEAGSNYEFTYLISDLAPPDQTIVRNSAYVKGSGVAAYGVGFVKDALDTGLTAAASSPSLALLGGYSGPAFSTTARDDSPVQNFGRTGIPILLTGGEMANYTFTYLSTPAEASMAGQVVYIYRRPIYVKDFITDTNFPIFTIYDNTDNSIFLHEVMYKGVQGPTVDDNGATVDEGDLDHYWFNVGIPTSNAENTDIYIPPTAKLAPPSGNAIVKHPPTAPDGREDNIALGITVEFPGRTQQDTFCTVGIKNLYLGAGYDTSNYWLLNKGLEPYSGIGTIETRDISNIRILAGPNKKLGDYTYGDTLDLTGLRVQIDYLDKDKKQQVRNITYQGPNSFENEGIYLRYYDSKNLTLSALTTQEKADIHDRDRRASSGDHLTVANTHESYITPARYRGGPWSPNEKYILLYTRLDEGNPFINHTYIYGEPDKDKTDFDSKHQIRVKPKVLSYSFNVDKKTYDGTDRAAGSITLSGVQNVPASTTGQPNRVDDFHPNGLQDVVWITTGASYEKPLQKNPLHGDFSAFHAHIGLSGVYTFSSGRFVDVAENVPRDGMLNGRLDFTGKNPYGTENSLTFRFLWPNVRYEESGATPHSLTNRAMPDSPLWMSDATRSQQKDVYGEVADMPVEVTGIALAGPDAANYTFENFTDEPSHSISFTYNKSSGTWLVTPAVSGGASTPYPMGNINLIPYAKIEKARRADIDVYVADAGMTLARPLLETDWHTNVVRVLFDIDQRNENSLIKHILAEEAKRNSQRVHGNANTPIPDAYENEVPEAHIEYSLEYLHLGTGLNFDARYATSGAIGKYVRGVMNAVGYQDTYYFGGETYRVAWPEGFEPDTTNEREPDRSTVFKGQRYKWTLHDKDFLQFEKDTGDPIIRNEPWDFDEGFVYTEFEDGGYYTTDRTPLARDAYVWARVRFSETHNYLPSEPLYSVDNSDAGSYYELSKTSANFKNEISAAHDYAQRRLSDIVAGANASRQDPDGEPPAAPVTKTYKYAMPVISSESARSVLDNQTYTVHALEEVWFTDKQEYSDSRQLDYVFENDITRRYREYYWDDMMQTRFEYQPDSLLFGVPFEITVNREDADKARFESDEWVNSGLATDGSYPGNEPYMTTNIPEVPDGGEIKFPVFPVYASTAVSESPIERWIKIFPRDIVVELGSEPVQLSVEFWPSIVPRYEIVWDSEAPEIASVDEEGILYFNAVGETLINATSFFGKTDYIKVTVLPGAEQPPDDTLPDGMFNTEYTGSYMEVDENYYFYPERGMTRAELVMLMAKLFVQQNAPEQHEVLFNDVESEEAYYNAVELLASAGIILGVGENTFAGKRLATRAETAAIIARMLQLDVAAYEDAELFSDIGKSETWAGAYISALADAGFTNGVGDGKFEPNRIVTRAEAAAFIARLLTYKTVDMEAEGLVIPVDVPETHWAYESVIRALNEVILKGKEEDESGDPPPAE